MKAADIERQFAPGEVIVEPGCVRRELYVVRSGDVRIEPSDGRPFRIGRGALFGELSVVLALPHAYCARAETPAAILVLDVSLVNRLCRESNEFAFALIRALAERCARRDEPIVRKLLGDAVVKRVAQAILERTEDLDGPSRVSGRLAELSQATDLPMREAYRGVQTLIEERVLRLADDQLTLIQPDRLLRLARAR